MIGSIPFISVAQQYGVDVKSTKGLHSDQGMSHMRKCILKVYEYTFKGSNPVIYIQSNFNGSNTFWTMKISSRQGYFEPTRVNSSARSGGIISISLSFYNMKVCCVFS